jgi:hypothetical protein
MRPSNTCSWWYGASIGWLLGCLLLTPLWAAEKGHRAGGETQHAPDFVLTRQGARVSLRAQQASLKAIVETLGHLLAIDVVARIPRDTQITLTFTGLSLEEALQRLRTYANIVYLKDTTPPAGKITRIVVIPMQGGERVVSPTVRGGAAPPPASAPSEPFKFEFDPSQPTAGKP